MTPVDTMWKWYGKSQGADYCEADLGYQLVERWKSTNETYCRPYREGRSVRRRGGSGPPEAI